MGKTVYTAKFKSDRMMEVLREEEQIGAIAARHNINPNLLRAWKKEFLEKSARVFDENRRERELAAREREMNAEHEELLKKIGQLTIERDWLKKKNQSKYLNLTTRKSLIKSRCDLTIERQCELLEVNLSTYYYKPMKKSAEQLECDEKLRAAIDRWHAKMPYLGCRKLVDKKRPDS